MQFTRWLFLLVFFVCASQVCAQFTLSKGILSVAPDVPSIREIARMGVYDNYELFIQNVVVTRAKIPRNEIREIHLRCFALVRFFAEDDEKLDSPPFYVMEQMVLEVLDESGTTTLLCLYQIRGLIEGNVTGWMSSRFGPGSLRYSQPVTEAELLVFLEQCDFGNHTTILSDAVCLEVISFGDLTSEKLRKLLVNGLPEPAIEQRRAALRQQLRFQE